MKDKIKEILLPEELTHYNNLEFIYLIGFERINKIHSGLSKDVKASILYLLRLEFFYKFNKYNKCLDEQEISDIIGDYLDYYNTDFEKHKSKFINENTDLSILISFINKYFQINK